MDRELFPFQYKRPADNSRLSAAFHIDVSTVTGRT